MRATGRTTARPARPCRPAPVRAARRAGRSPAPGRRPCRPPASADRPTSSAPRTRSTPPPSGIAVDEQRPAPVARRRDGRRRRRTPTHPHRPGRRRRRAPRRRRPRPPRPAPAPPPARAPPPAGRSRVRRPPPPRASTPRGGGSPDTATTTPRRRGSPAVGARTGGGRVEHDDRRARPAPASLGGVEGAHDLASGRRGRPQHARRAAPCRTPSPARAGPRPALAPSPASPARRSVVRASAPTPRRPARCGPHVKRGARRPSGPTSWSAVDGGSRMWTTRRFRRRPAVSVVRHDEAPCLRRRARSATVGGHRAPNRYRLRRPWARSARGGRTGRPPSGGIDGGRRRFSSGGLS